MDYCNGGPVFWGAGAEGWWQEGQQGPQYASCSQDTSQTRGQALAQVQVLAVYSELGPGAAAAIRCRVGKGVAVLVGTHPELPPHALAPHGSMLAPQTQASMLSSAEAESPDPRAAYQRLVL